MRQIDLFEHVASAYAQPASGRLTNAELYRIAAGRAGIDTDSLNARSPIGRTGTPRSTAKRSIRWHQQTLRSLGLIDRVKDLRGVWELTEAGKQQLRKVPDDIAVLGFSTKLGVALLGNCRHVFKKWDEPVFLVLTSPPYPLRTPRAYGNPPVEEYVDFITEALEPIVPTLVPGGNIVLSLSNDIFEQRSPARSLYLEKLTIALCERLGLHLMDRLVWECKNKAPGPVQWASKERMQLHTKYEHLLWFCNAPTLCIADNRRVLEPHTESHRQFVANGGTKHATICSDGAYRKLLGAYATPTAGRIPGNVISVSNSCASQRQYKKMARALGLQPHGAPMPLALAQKLVRFMTDVGQLVVDLFGGSGTTDLACELENRRWASTDIVYDYVRGSATRFADCPEFELAVP